MSYEIHPSPTGDDPVRRIVAPLAAAAGWMKFLAVLSIVYGFLVALSVVGLLIAWMPFWIGILLWQSANHARDAMRTGDEDAAAAAVARLKTLFTIQGVLVIIGIALTLLVVGALAGSGSGMSGISNLFTP